MRVVIQILALLAVFGLLMLGCEKSAANITSASPDTQYTIDSSTCQGCAKCVDVCPYGAIQMINGKAVIVQSKCKQCGECTKVCPRDAIH